MDTSLIKARNFFKENFDFTLPIPEMRVAAEKMYGKLPVAKDVTVEPINIDGLPAEWTTTPEARDTHVLYYLHGGGFIFGSPTSHRGEISELGRQAQSKTLAIDYRLAPENPFPAQIDDAVKGYLWLLENGYKPENISIAGDSAGGNLTISLMLTLRDSNIPLPGCAVAISPWIDMAQTGESYLTKEGIDPINSKASLISLAEGYLSNYDTKTPFASPMYANVYGLPPIYVVVGEAEVMLSEACTFATKAGMAGVHVRLEIFPKMIHNWPLWHSFLPEGAEAIKKAGLFIREFTN